MTGQVLAVDGGWSVSDGQIPLRGEPQPQQPKEVNLVSKLFSLWKKFR